MTHKLLLTISSIFFSFLLFSNLSCETVDKKPSDFESPKESAPLVGEKGIKSQCDDWAVINDGIYKYENNVWGADKNLPYQQCLLERNKNGEINYGWSWRWRGKAPNWVFSYPEIIVGWKPWGESLPTHQGFPIKISEIKTLDLKYSVDLQAQGSYNLAPEIWLISRKPKSFPIKNPQNLITYEIMFWMDYSAGATPAGKKMSEFEFGGKHYDLWYKKDHNNSGDTVSWSILSLVSKTKQHTGSIDIQGLLKKLNELGYDIDENEYVANVEFGTEVHGISDNSKSHGFLWINNYDVVLESY